MINFYLIGELSENEAEIEGIIPIDSEFTSESAILLQCLVHLSDKNIMGERTVRKNDILTIGDDRFVFEEGRFVKRLNQRQKQINKNIEKARADQIHEFNYRNRIF